MLVIMLVYNLRAISNFIKLIQKANLVLINKTSFKKYTCSLRLLFKAVKTTKELVVHVLCLRLILINIQVLRQVSLVFVACSSSLQVS